MSKNISEDLIRKFNLTSIADVRVALDLLALKPSKLLGQNFLVDANILALILKAADLSAGDQVVEIGAGLGVLTEALAETVKRLVAIEKDKRLADFLAARLKTYANTELIIEDVMRLNLQKLWQSGINKLVANLPYSVGSALLAEIFMGKEKPREIIVTLQAEVARRLVAGPNTDDYGLLSIWCQLNYAGKIQKKISANCFYPRPEVDSAIVRLDLRQEEIPVNREYFFKLTKYAFSRRRKQMQKILSTAPPQFRLTATELNEVFREMGIDPHIRPEVLSIEQWVQLAAFLKNMA
jgi:16S rRNA (adenine1518-N6/adenine1519-N6)-dimethyltransferase